MWKMNFFEDFGMILNLFRFTSVCNVLLRLLCVWFTIGY